MRFQLSAFSSIVFYFERQHGPVCVLLIPVGTKIGKKIEKMKVVFVYWPMTLDKQMANGECFNDYLRSLFF